MDIYGKDIIIGDFRASDFGLILSSFDYDEKAEDEMGNDISIAEQFVGRNPVPVYLDYSYTNKLKPTITVIKYNCHNASDFELTEFEIRHILRLLTGHSGYKWMKVVTEEISEDTWYKVKVNKTSLLKIGNQKAGLKIEMECDSQFGYSPVQIVKNDINAYEHFYIFNNSDDIYTYLLPKLSIKIKEGGNWALTNHTEDWTTMINNTVTDENITMDSERQILLSDVEHTNVLLNDFNLHWVRLLSGINEYSVNLDCEITFEYRMRRKGGFICN